MSDFQNFSVGYQVTRAAHHFDRALARALQPLGLSPGQFPTLLALWHHDGQSQAELVRAVGVEQATLALTLNRMERDGLIRREPNPKDSRSRLIYLTRLAKGLEHPAIAAAAQVNARALADVTDEEAEQFLALTARIITTLRHGTE